MGLPDPRALERVLVDAVDHEPDTEVIDTPDWVQVRTPSSLRKNHNGIFVARLPDALVDARVAEVAAEHAARGAKYRWFVGPSSGPDHLAERIEASGCRFLGPTAGMAMAVPARDLPLGIEGLTIHEMGPDDVDAYAEVTTRAWVRGSDFTEAVRYIAAKSFRVRRPGTSTVSWTARLHGEPVATSHLRLFEGLGYLQGCAVLPSHRGRGIYRALVHHRLAYLRRTGRAVAVIWADATSSGIACGKIGFRTVCTGAFFESPDDAPAA